MVSQVHIKKLVLITDNMLSSQSLPNNFLIKISLMARPKFLFKKCLPCLCVILRPILKCYHYKS